MKQKLTQDQEVKQREIQDAKRRKPLLRGAGARRLQKDSNSDLRGVENGGPGLKPILRPPKSYLLVRFDKNKEALAKKKAKRAFVIPGTRKKLNEEASQKARPRKVKTVTFHTEPAGVEATMEQINIVLGASILSSFGDQRKQLQEVYVRARPDPALKAPGGSHGQAHGQ
jgi:hypothetical protein